MGYAVAVRIVCRVLTTMSIPSSPGPSTYSVDLPSNANDTAAILPGAFYSSISRSHTLSSGVSSLEPTSTPISNKMSGQTYAATVLLGQDANVLPAHETSGLFLGPMPPNQFLLKFLHVDQLGACPEAKGVFSKVLRAQTEVQMYEPFVSDICTYI